MTGNISYLSEYEPFNRGYVSFGHGRGKITGKGSIKTGTGPDWLFDIDTLTNSMNYVPVVVAGTSSSNILVTSSVLRIISRGGSIFPEPLYFGNDMPFENRLEDFFEDTSNAVSLNEVEADLSNMETPIQVSLTPTLRIHKDHPK
nr:hypothetical protein [Tanacetum cinerariifolium]